MNLWQVVNDGVSMGPPRPPPAGRESGRALPNWILAAALLTLGLVMLATAVSVYAIFTGSTSVTPNDFNSDTLDPPTSVTATSGSSIDLNWTATVDTYASGHRVLRGTAAGGPYSQIAEVTPRTTTTYTDSPVAGTYYYVVRAFYQSWESANSNEASATVTTTGFRSCTANAAVITGSGDNNGFELNPANACSDDAAFAQDTDSGSNTTTVCSDTGKDRHQFYNYGFTIPAGSSISGIEVRLDAWADNTAQSPFMCVELSWDGGVTWTAAKSTTTLGTSEASFTLGTNTDSWGRTWATTDFADANFRVRITNVAGHALRDFFLDWVAVKVTATTGFRSCAANAAVTTTGDNDGFETNPANACANDAAFAQDINSGTNNPTTCSDPSKDRHLYYNYGFTIPAGSSISGIEVRLDAWADGTAGVPSMCVELSWDGGTTWTVAKTTATLGTTEATFILGTTTDTWGRTWASTDFADANFRVRITNMASNITRDFFLDWVAVQVSYVAP